MKTYIFDIDGTLTDASHRVHLVEGNTPDWGAFFDGCEDDEPITPTIELLNYFLSDPNNIILLFSGRSEKVRDKTINWLERHTDYRTDCENAILQMRAVDDFTHDAALKKQWFEALPDDVQKSVQIVFDDRSSVVEMWRELGLLVYQVDEGNF